jgi:hypothetical protein
MPHRLGPLAKAKMRRISTDTGPLQRTAKK